MYVIHVYYYVIVHYIVYMHIIYVYYAVTVQYIVYMHIIYVYYSVTGRMDSTNKSMLLWSCGGSGITHSIWHELEYSN